MTRESLQAVMPLPDTERSSTFLTQYDSALWALAVCFFGAGDIATTGFGVATDGISEIGPLASLVLRRFGMGGMIGLKALFLGGSYGVWRCLPTPERVGVPLGLATVGVLVTLWNSWILLRVLG